MWRPRPTSTLWQDRTASAQLPLLRSQCLGGSRGLPWARPWEPCFNRYIPALPQGPAGSGASGSPCPADGESWCHQQAERGRLASPLVRRHPGTEGPQRRPEAPHPLLPGRGHHAPSLSAAGSVGGRQKGRKAESQQRPPAQGLYSRGPQRIRGDGLPAGTPAPGLERSSGPKTKVRIVSDGAQVCCEPCRPSGTSES